MHLAHDCTQSLGLLLLSFVVWTNNVFGYFISTCVETDQHQYKEQALLKRQNGDRWTSFGIYEDLASPAVDQTIRQSFEEQQRSSGILLMYYAMHFVPNISLPLV